MRLGILADIHEDVVRLTQAIQILKQRESVETLILLGDIFEMGQAIGETVDVLTKAAAIGVWGNHDLGFCHAPDPATIRKYSADVCQFMGTLRPRWEVGPCLFTHGLPHWDPTDPSIYYVGERLGDEGMHRSVFASTLHELMFVGHFHRWKIWNTQGEVDWDGHTAISLGFDQRYLIVVNAVVDGWCATFDTQTRHLKPISIGN